MAAFSSSLADTLTQDEIPVKLRCASCNKLVVNAFRLPCCDQNICEKCQALLPESCPVCMHSPLSADDCKPNKSLRLTVKAFLKNEEKKRDKLEAVTTSSVQASASQQPESVSSVQPPATSVAPTLEQKTAVTAEATALEAPASQEDPIIDSLNETGTEQIELALQDVAQFGKVTGALASVDSEGDKPAAQSNVQIQEQGQNEDLSVSKDANQQQLLSGSLGFDVMNNGFGQANWTGGYNPMLNMQNGMASGAWGNFPNMMGMSAGAMNPMMMSQGMFGGFNGQGMGMNGMNMGMGFDGGFGGWGGQTAMGMGGMNGGFGANAGYYPPGGYNQQSHQGHFNQMQQPQFPMHNSNQNRFRGHGYSQRLLDRGMGRHGQTAPGHASNSVAMHQGEDTIGRQFSAAASNGHLSQQTDMSETQVQQSLSHDGPQDEASTSSAVNHADDTNPIKENQLDNDDIALSIEADTKTDEQYDKLVSMSAENAVKGIEMTKEGADEDRLQVYTPENEEKENFLQPIATVDSTEPPPFQYNEPEPMTAVSPLGPNVPLGPAAQFATPSMPDYTGRGRGFMRPYGRAGMGRGMLRGRGGMARMQLTFDHMGVREVLASPPPPIGQGVVGAPTGPKAMREGTANVGLRGRGGFQVAGRGGKIVAPVAPVASATADKDLVGQEGSVSKASKPRSRSPSRSRSNSRHQSRRHRSASVSEKAYDSSGQRKSKKRRRSHRYEDVDQEENAEHQERRRYSREPSTESRHRSHRDKGKGHSSRHDRSRSPERHKRKHRSRERARDASAHEYAVEESYTKEAHSGSSSRAPHRSRRDSVRDERDRDRGKDLDRERDRDSDRRRSRRDRSTSPDHRSHHHESAKPKTTSSSVEQPKQNQTPAQAQQQQQQQQQQQLPPTEPHEFKIKDRSKRPPSDMDVQKTIARDERPTIDAHTLEREARNRERLKREMERRESLHGGGGGVGSNGMGMARKRSADEAVPMPGAGGDEAGHSRNSKRRNRHGDDRKGRRGGRHYDDDDENGEARAARVEKEREASRWG